MLRTTLTAPLLLLAAYIQPSLACPGHTSSPSPRDGTYPIFTTGSDAAADPATTGFFTNHFAFNVRDLNASLNFYTSVFGFRHLFTYQLSPHYSFAYLAHASGGRNGTGYQTTAEMLREKNNRQGLLELLFYDDPEAHANMTSSTQVTNTFGHMGIVVPDLAAALARFEEMGVNIVAKPGDTPQVGGDLTNAFGLSSLRAGDPETEMILEGFKATLNGLVFIKDPDNNLIEVYPQEQQLF